MRCTYSYFVNFIDPGLSEWWCINYGFITWLVGGNVTDFTSEVWYVPRGLTFGLSNQGKLQQLETSYGAPNQAIKWGRSHSPLSSQAPTPNNPEDRKNKTRFWGLTRLILIRLKISFTFIPPKWVVRPRQAMGVLTTLLVRISMPFERAYGLDFSRMRTYHAAYVAKDYFHANDSCVADSGDHFYSVGR